MKCPSCKKHIDHTDAKINDADIDNATELLLTCPHCGERFYTFVEHRDWVRMSDDARVDLQFGEAKNEN